MRYHALNLIRGALERHRRWPAAWRDAAPRSGYDIVIIGAGGHGLATAWYLASEQGLKNIAVLEKGYLGGGNSGRNTQVCRSNYFYPESGAFFEHSLQLYEGLAEELNFNIMLSQRGVLTLSASPHELELCRRWANAIRLNNVDSRILDRQQIKRRVPQINLDCRFPIRGGFIQERGGTSRHDAVAWAFARKASERGVDLIQDCEVTGMETSDSRVTAVKTSKGTLSAKVVALCVAGHSSQLAAMAGIRLPIHSLALQALVSEPMKAFFDTMLMSPRIHAYISQSDRGELVMGGGADPFPSFAQRGTLPIQQDCISALMELFPSLGRLRMMRQWAGVCDLSPDVSPIVGRTPVENLFVSTGWGTGGYKAIPAGGQTLAHTIATGETHPLLKPFQLDRFRTGQLIDEGAAAGVAH